MTEPESTSIYLDNISVKDFRLRFNDGRIIIASDLLKAARTNHAKCYVELTTYEEEIHHAEDDTEHTHYDYSIPYIFLNINREPEGIENPPAWVSEKSWMFARAAIVEIEVEHTADDEIRLQKELDALK